MAREDTITRSIEDHGRKTLAPIAELVRQFCEVSKETEVDTRKLEAMLRRSRKDSERTMRAVKDEPAEPEE